MRTVGDSEHNARHFRWSATHCTHKFVTSTHSHDVYVVCHDAHTNYGELHTIGDAERAARHRC